MAHSTPKSGCNGTLTPFAPDTEAGRRGQEVPVPSPSICYAPVLAGMRTGADVGASCMGATKRGS
jgi:hypothetical protein